MRGPGEAAIDLFGHAPDQGPALPAGLVYQPEFLDRTQERELVELIQRAPLEAMRYRAYTARRKVLSFGGKYDFQANRLHEAQPVPAELEPLRQCVAQWLGVQPHAFTQIMLAEYSQGTPLGWHRDVPDFEDIVGISLLAPATLKFRPWPPENLRRSDVVKLELEPRSIYLLRGAARWQWQHSVEPTRSLRYSITLRTARQRP